MSDVIDADPGLAGLPPPLLLSVTEATQLVYRLRDDRTGGTVVQLIAAENREGVSTLVRDLCLVAAGTMRLRTLLIAAEPPTLFGSEWPRSIYGMPSYMRPVYNAPSSLQMLSVGATPLVLATPSSDVPMQASSWNTLLRDLRASFDFAVIDPPATARSFTGIMLAPHLDATVIVTAAESTRVSAVKTLRDQLTEGRGYTAGVILNKRRVHMPKAIYDRL